MTPSMIVEIIRQVLMTTFWLSLPILAVGFVAGMIISLAQVVTSMQDPSVGTVPRLAAYLLALVVLLPWMLTRLMGYATGIFGDLGRYAR